MKYLLTKEQVLLKESILISEKAVDWNKSALGILTGAVLSPLSWLTGSIKTGIKKSQLNGLSIQWGLEYVKALEALDKNIDVKQDAGVAGEDDTEVETETQTTPTDDKTFKITEDNKNTLLDSLKKEQTYFNSANNVVKEMTGWTTYDNQQGYETVKKKLAAIPETDTHALIDVVPLMDAKYADTPTHKDSVINFINDIIKLNISDFHKKYKITVPTEANGRKTALNDLLITKIADFTGINNACVAAISFVTNFKPDAGAAPAKEKIDFKVGNEYIHTDKKGNKTVVKLISLDYSVKAGDDKVFLTDDDVNVTEIDPKYAFVALKGKNVGYAVNIKNLSEKANESAMILEAKSFKIPSRVEDLMPAENLDEYKQKPDIKNLTFPKINLKRLDSIKYEANFILNKSKDPKSQEKNADLLRVWEMGIKNVNDYFQEVIDVDKVMTEVKGVVDGKVEQIVKDNGAKIDKLQGLGISEVVPVGTKFNVNKLYAFDCTITGQNNKAENTMLMMSPTAEFVETIDDKNYYWFKLLGAYDYDLKSSKVVRKNLFTNLTSNKSITNNFNNVESAYYAVFTNLRSDPRAFYFEIYSNKGKFFFNGKVVDDVDTVADDITTYKQDKFVSTRKKIASVSNFFKIKINQRFSVDDANVASNKYPGIQMADLKTDKGIDTAKANHEKFMALLK